MRLALLTCLISLATGLVGAAQDRQQRAQGVYFVQTIVEVGVDADAADVAAATTLVNPTDRDLEVRWTREVNDLPEGWTSKVCDPGECFPVYTDTERFVIPANSEISITPHVYPNGLVGDALVTVRVEEVGNAANNAVATFNFARSARVARRDQRVTLFPNPGSEEFRVISDEPLSSVTLTNMLGKVVREFPAYLSTYDVSDLPNGVYLATLVGVDGQVLRTLRFSKRQVRP